MRFLMWVLAGAAALPLLACLTRRPGREAWLIAAAFAVSLAMDLVSDLMPGHDNAWVGYLGYPVQFALLIIAVAKDAPALGIGLGGLLVVAFGSSAVPVGLSMAGHVAPQEVMLRAIAGLGVAYLAWENPFLNRFRGPVMLYAVGCLPFVIVMALFPRTERVWLWVWALYQGVRLTALCWMAGLVFRENESPQNVSDGSRVRQVHRRREDGHAARFARG